MSDFIGKTIGGYRIIEQIGLGGMATVFKAYQPSMDRYVAFKIISTHLAGNPAFVERFRQEARVIARLEHAHILPVHDYGEQDGYLYLVMRFVEGGTLKDRLAGGALLLDEVRRIVAQVGSALEYAHQRGVVHRDFKPSNVLIDLQGNCYLSDFGIAKMVEGTLGVTGSGVLGTPHYMAPEQGQSLNVDQRADIYAMGIVIYEMVTGRVPFDAETPFAVVMKHLTEPLPLPRRIKPDLPEEVERVILKALAKTPADRYQRMGDLVAAFDQAVVAAPLSLAGREVKPTPSASEGLNVPAPARPAEAAPVAPPAPRKTSHRRLWLLAAAGLALLMIILAVFTLSNVAPEQKKTGSGEVRVALGESSTPASATLPAQPAMQMMPATPAPRPNPAPSPTVLPAQELAKIPTQSPAVPASAWTAPSPTTAPLPPTSMPTEPTRPAGDWGRIADLPRQINSLVADPADPQVLYAATGIYGSGGGGVYKSQDGGITWRLAVKGLPDDVVKALAFSRDVPPRLYAAVGPSGDIYASGDGAESWTRVGVNPYLCCNLGRQIFVSPDNGNVVFALETGGGGRGSYSRDGGQNWQVIRDERGELGARSLAIDPADANVVYLGTEGNGVYKSIDGGETWLAANQGILDYQITALAVDPARPQTLYAGGDGGELFKSSDGGGSWSDLTGRLSYPAYGYIGEVMGIAPDPAAPERIYVLVEGVGLLISSDGGERWQMMGKPGGVESPSFTALLVRFEPQFLLILGVEDQGGWRYAVN